MSENIESDDSEIEEEEKEGEENRKELQERADARAEEKREKKAVNKEESNISFVLFHRAANFGMYSLPFQELSI